MSEENGYVHLETDELGISTITFLHPQSNSLPSFLLNKLAQTIEDAGLDNKTKVIKLQSDGNRTFCAGASFDELQSIENIDDENQPVSCPKFFTNISYDNEKGFLNFFKTKNDSSSFLSRYIHSISKNIPFHKSEISFHPMKNIFCDINS